MIISSSHVIAALADLTEDGAQHVVFFGGTALCRTWCPDLRLSEEIDLLINTWTRSGTSQPAPQSACAESSPSTYGRTKASATTSTPEPCRRLRRR